MTEEEIPVDPTKGILRRRIISFVVPVLAAIVLLLAIRAGRPEPAKRPINTTGAPARVIEAQAKPVNPRAVGYGVVQAAYEWELVAEVSGRVVEMNKELRVGTVLAKGTKLLQINPQNYQLTEKQRRASLQNVKAQIQQLEAQRQSAKANLEIEQQSLELAQRDLKRTRALFASGSATQADIDSAQRNALAQRSAVQQLQNQLREIPANMAALRAQERESKASLEGAQLDVGRTEIFAPFDIRIRELSIQPSELVTSGQVLAVAEGVDAAEVVAQLTLGALQPFFDGASTPAKASRVQSTQALGRQLRDLNLQAIVRIESGDLLAEWNGEVTRITTVNATTRTLGVVVAVGEAVDSGGTTPPLLSGMYAEVELTGKKQTACLAVPRSAVRSANQLYVVDKASRLIRREVKIGLRQAAFVCIREGLSAGEKVVLTDIQPAVQGMLLAPTIDQTSTERLLQDLEGKGFAK